jgi:hypothetical protein
MGTIIGRSRKDGSKAFTAQIVIKKDGVIVHREAQTFDRKPAANAWIVKREAELKRPGGLERKEDPALAAVIDRYIEESKNVVHGTKAQVLKTLKNSDLGEIKCSARDRQIDAERETRNLPLLHRCHQCCVHTCLQDPRNWRSKISRSSARGNFALV